MISVNRNEFNDIYVLSRRLMFEAVYALANGNDTIAVEVERTMDLHEINKFIRYCNDPVITEVLSCPGKYLTEQQAKLLGAHTGQKTTKAIRKYMIRIGMEVPDAEYCRFADAISPCTFIINYKISARKEYHLRWIDFTSSLKHYSFTTGGWEDDDYDPDTDDEDYDPDTGWVSDHTIQPKDII